MHDIASRRGDAESELLDLRALQMPDVGQHVAPSLITEFENFTVFKPGDQNVTALRALLSQVITWSAALASLRAAHACA